MFEFIDVQQNTEEWLALRCRRLNGSKLGTVMANYGKAFGDPAKRYAKHIALEQITGKPTRSGYKSEDMERGHEEEPIAVQEYEKDMFCTVTNGGFFCNDEIGCSPDGLVGDYGMIEVKSEEAHIHFDRATKATYASAYKWQLIGNLKFAGRDWMDFVSYCSDYPKGNQLYVYRMYKEQFVEEFNMIDIRTAEFLAFVKECKAKILSSNYFILDKD